MSPLRCLLFALTWATLTPAAHANPDRTATLAIQPAQGALYVPADGAPGLVAAWAPDMRSVLGFSARGERLWRVSTGEHGGARDLRTLGTSLIAYTGKEALAIAPTTGKVTGRRELTLPDPERPTEGCELTHRGGACALRCACSFELVDCATLATVGPKVTMPALAPVDSRPGQCPWYFAAPLGRAGETLIAAFPVAPATPFFGLAEEVLAVSTVGEILWRSSNFGRVDPERSGVGADGVTCFVGARSGALSVFDCQRATPRWRREVTVTKAIEPQVVASAEGLLVRDGRRLYGLSLADGASRWSLDLPPRTVALADLEPQSVRQVWASRPDTLALVAGGRVRASLPLPTGLSASPLASAQLLVAVGARELVVYKAEGQPLATLGRRADLAPLVAGQALLLATPDKVELHVAGDTLTRRAVFEGVLAKARPVALELAGDRALVVLHREGRSGWDPADPETFGELHFVAAPLR